MAGQILGGNYQVERELGKQSGRWTLLARDLNTQELVVIKLLCVDQEVEWDDLKLFEREVETLKNLSHPSTPRYLGYFEHSLPNGKALALVQTYIEGRSLEQCIQAGRKFNEAEAKQLARATLKILAYLHNHQPPIIHRDIKPGNILLGNRQLYLVDFGSVKTFLTGETSSFTVVGTYGYTPPEQFSGRALAASDLYSLGATLIAIITGTHPSSLPHKGTRIDLAQVADLSPGFLDWLERMTESSLDRRFKTAEQALQALDADPHKTVPAPPPVQKPEDSKVTLTHEGDQLEIIIPSLLGQTQLLINSQRIVLTTRRLGLQANRPQVALRQDLNRLVYAGKPTEEGTGSPLTLWAGAQPFELGVSPTLTPAELDWLASELSQWLKLPISPS